jgi:membrane-associated phospholipid phosphatase
VAVAVDPARQAAPAGKGRQPSLAQAEEAPRRSRQHWAGVGIYVVLLSVWIVAKGLPLTRIGVALWLMAGMLAFSSHDLRKWIDGLALEWFPFIAFLFLYDIARGFADNVRAVNVHAAIDGDRWLFFGHVPTPWLQRYLWHGTEHLRWYDYGAWGVYMTYFFATLVVAAALWIFAYHRFRRYVAAVSVLTITGFTTYVLFPAAPPWYASSHGALGPSERLTNLVWTHALPSFSTVVKHGDAFANPVAAMPSLHAGFTLLVTLSLWRSAKWWGRIPLAVYPLLMGFTLVYFAEHYVTDIIAGWVYAIVAYLGVEWFGRRRMARRVVDLRVAAVPVVAADEAG